MNRYIETLSTYLAEHPPEYEYPWIESLLDVLYDCFCIRRPLDTESIRTCIREQDSILKKLSLKEHDRVADFTCDLCGRYEREAFRLGLLVGFRLFGELNNRAP